MAAEDRDLRHDRQLHDNGEEEESRRLGCVGGRHGAFGVRFFVISAVTASSDEKSTNGWIWICLYERRVALTDADDDADRDVGREQRRVLLRARPGRHDHVAFARRACPS